MLTKTDILKRVAFHESEAAHWRGVLAAKSCRTCEHWGNGGCNKADGAIPPTEIQRTGCDEWAHDFIPF